MKELVTAIVPLAIIFVLLCEIATIAAGLLSQFARRLKGDPRAKRTFAFDAFCTDLATARRRRSIPAFLKAYMRYPAEASIMAIATVPAGFVAMVAWAYLIEVTWK